jgi:UDP-N-acetylglucosamine--N-acetylmuramyl-(pentapeptide) pyrophosphoryl-undecaprenol N-acetylglucosamine transferase
VVFEEAQKYLSKNAILIPYPLKYQEKDRIKDPVAVKKHLGIMQDKKILLILGGSQGSQEVIEKVYNLFLLCSLQERSQYELIIQSGNNNPEEIKKKFFQSGIIVNTFSFVDDMSSYYIIADKVITRGGAGTLFELVFFKKQSFIIPLRSVAQDHQFLNAISMCKKYDFLKTEENYTLQEFLFS